MDKQKLQNMIGKMLHPGITVNSLTMFAGKLIAKYGQDGLQEFLTALCRLDIYKAMMITRQLPVNHRNMAETLVSNELAERCENVERFSYLELLAIAVCKDGALLQTASPLLTQEIIEEAMERSDNLTACSLLQLGLTALPREICDQMQKAFCKLLSSQYNERMERDLSQLLPCLLEQDAAEVLSTLVEIVGVERVSGFYGEELTEALDRLILSGKDGVGIWELFFFRFFQQDHTQEELLHNGLWYVQLFAGDEIYDQVCAGFFLRLAARYGVEHPILVYIDDLSSSETDSWEYMQQYKDAILPLWAKPHKLPRFLEKTAPCNPFRKLEVLRERYHLLHTAQDRIAYGWLQGLFEAGLPVHDILTVFFSTELKQRLPLEDLFYLAQRHELLPQLLEALGERPFAGRVTGRYSHQLFMSPYSYFSTELHTVPITYKILENLGNTDQLKGQDLQYTIVDFVGGSIKVVPCDTATLSESKENDAVTWEAAIEQLRQEKSLQHIPKKKLPIFAITKFTLDDVMKENHLNLFTELLMERSDCLGTFLKLLRICKWNASFQKAGLPLPKDFFSMVLPHQQKSVELFRFLLEANENVTLVLQLYFFSIYRAIVPLNQLLLFAPRERLLEQLPNFVITCQPLEDGSSPCCPDNINCAPVCYMEITEGASFTDPFDTVITDFTVEDHQISGILLQPYQKGAADIKERGALFGTLGSSIQIPSHLQQRLALLPPASNCGYRELKFNIRCMEDAFLLRRSNATELKSLIQTLGNANPFAFGVNLTVERIYLSKANRKEDAENSIVSMVLNAESIEDIRDFYLHTHIKFHLQLPQLATLIRERRSGLEDQIYGMFDGVDFYAIADSRGNLWMPWVPQNTLQISPKYAGKVLSCQLHLEKYGTIHVHVKEAKENNSFFQILNICLLSGYGIDCDMDALAENLQASIAIKEAPWGYLTPSYGEYFSQLIRMIPGEQFSYEDFSQAIQKMIVSYSKISITRMEHAVVTLIRKWLQYHTDREQIPFLLQKICQRFDQKYPDGYRHGDLIQQLSLYLGTETVQDLNTQIRKAPPTQKEPSREVRERDSFADACEKLQQTLPYTYSLKRVASLIHTYHARVTREELEAGILALTAQRMQIQSSDNDALLRDLILIHTDFIKYCQSGSLGLILIQQGYQYMSEDLADRLERGICKYTYRNFKHQPELIQMLPPYNQWLTRLQSRLQDPQYPCDDAVKRIGKLLRHYNSIISVEEMEQTVLALMEPLIKQFSTRSNMSRLLNQLHTSFERHYGTSNIGSALWHQLCRQLDNDIACALQVSQPLPPRTFVSRIGSLISNHTAYIPAEEMKQAVLRLTEQWIIGASEEDAVPCLLNIHNHFVYTYASAELCNDLCQLVNRHLGQSARDSLFLRISKATRLPTETASAATLPSLESRKELLSRYPSRSDYPAKSFVDKLHTLILRFAGKRSAEEIAETIVELVEKWLQQHPDKALWDYYLCGIHDCFVNNCRTDHLTGLLCQLSEKYMDQNTAETLAVKLQDALQKLQ